MPPMSELYRYEFHNLRLTFWAGCRILLDLIAHAAIVGKRVG